MQVSIHTDSVPAVDIRKQVGEVTSAAGGGEVPAFKTQGLGSCPES